MSTTRKFLWGTAVILAVVAGYLFLVKNVDAATPAEVGLKEGDLIRATGDNDIFIVNEYGYKRLFLNPAIFNMYGHLGGWVNVKTVTPAVRDAFVTSPYYRADGDTKIYKLEVTGDDTGVLRWVNMTKEEFLATGATTVQIFTINGTELAWYAKGADITATPPVQAPVLDNSLTVQRTTGSRVLIGWDATANAGTFTFKVNPSLTVQEDYELASVSFSFPNGIASASLDGTNFKSVKDGKVTFGVNSDVTTGGSLSKTVTVKTAKTGTKLNGSAVVLTGWTATGKVTDKAVVVSGFDLKGLPLQTPSDVVAAKVGNFSGNYANAVSFTLTAKSDSGYTSKLGDVTLDLDRTLVGGTPNPFCTSGQPCTYEAKIGNDVVASGSFSGASNSLVIDLDDTELKDGQSVTVVVTFGGTFYLVSDPLKSNRMEVTLVDVDWSDTYTDESLVIPHSLTFSNPLVWTYSK